MKQRSFLITGCVGSLVFLAACGAQPGGNIANSGVSNANVNSNSNSNSMANASNTNSTDTTVSVDVREPEAYQALVTLKAEATGQQQKTQLPTLQAKVARNSADRRMEFTMPAGGRVVFLDKGGVNYVILPDMNQYAVLDKEATGFDIRRMLMPEQIVNQAKTVPGMQLVGEETYNGRQALKYKYAAVANTQSQAGNVTTESFMLVDKDTGLPLHTETMSQAQSGANVQGYNGLRVITEMTDISPNPSADLFAEPTNMKKVESAQVRAQVDMIFRAAASLLGQMLNQGQAAPSSATPIR